MRLMWNPGDPRPDTTIDAADDDTLNSPGGHSGILSVFALSWPPSLDGGSPTTPPAFPTQRLFTGIDAYAPGGITPTHTHNDREKVFIVLDGLAEFSVGGETRILSPGGFAVVPVNAEHAFANAGDGILRVAQIITYLGPIGQAR